MSKKKCQHEPVIPTTYKASMSYFEELCKVITKVNEIIDEVNKLEVDDALSISSENPVQNKVITRALNLKADILDLYSHIQNTSNPHQVTKAQVGLGNVNNTSDLNKPISNAVQDALDTLENIISQIPIIEVDEELSPTSTNPLENRAVYIALQNVPGSIIDTELSPTSENAVQNKVIYNEFATTDERIMDIEDIIPSQASPTNELADKDFVNSSIATNTAYFKGTYDLVEDLGLTKDATEEQIATALATIITNPTNNDYSFVFYQDATTGITEYYDRYKYDSTEWTYEFTLNNSSFTAQQWATINSGLSASDKTKLDGIESGAQVNVTNGITINEQDVAINPTTKKQAIPITGERVMGLIASSSYFGTFPGDLGGGIKTLSASNLQYSQYQSAIGNSFISKGTLENVLDNETTRIDKAQSLTDAQKQQARSNIGAIDNTTLSNAISTALSNISLTEIWSGNNQNATINNYNDYLFFLIGVAEGTATNAGVTYFPMAKNFVTDHSDSSKLRFQCCTDTQYVTYSISTSGNNLTLTKFSGSTGSPLTIRSIYGFKI